MLELNIVILLTVVVTIALFFALSNGLHDASSVVATFITCGAANPVQAILLASVFELLGALTGGSAVANTVSKIIHTSMDASLLVILTAALLGAVVWNVLTWVKGLPSSSTHALVGGLIGAVWVASGPSHIHWGFRELMQSQHEITGIVKVIVALIISPVLGFTAAFLLQKVAQLLLRQAKFEINKTIKALQWVLTALLAYSHGANDTQKIIGIITLALTAVGLTMPLETPLWVRLGGGMVMFVGVLFGGWSIMKTLGRGIFTIRPIHSLNSQLASGGSLLAANLLGAPVSTTHTVVGTIIGVGAADEFKMVNWGIGKDIVVAWCITIPCSALVSALIYYPVLWLTQLM